MDNEQKNLRETISGISGTSYSKVQEPKIAQKVVKVPSVSENSIRKLNLPIIFPDNSERTSGESVPVRDSKDVDNECEKTSGLRNTREPILSEPILNFDNIREEVFADWRAIYGSLESEIVRSVYEEDTTESESDAETIEALNEEISDFDEFWIPSPVESEDDTAPIETAGNSQYAPVDDESEYENALLTPRYTPRTVRRRTMNNRVNYYLNTLQEESDSQSIDNEHALWREAMSRELARDVFSSPNNWAMNFFPPETPREPYQSEIEENVADSNNDNLSPNTRDVGVTRNDPSLQRMVFEHPDPDVEEPGIGTMNAFKHIATTSQNNVSSGLSGLAVHSSTGGTFLDSISSTNGTLEAVSDYESFMQNMGIGNESVEDWLERIPSYATQVARRSGQEYVPNLTSNREFGLAELASLELSIEMVDRSTQTDEPSPHTLIKWYEESLARRRAAYVGDLDERSTPQEE